MQYTLSRGGETLPLDESDGWVVEPGVEGLDTPPVALGVIEPADVEGEFVANVRHKARVITMPLSMWAAGNDEARAKTRRLASLLNPQLGPVTLTVRHPSSGGQLLPADAVDGKVTEWEASNVATTISEAASPKRSGTVSLKIELTGVISGDGYIGARLPAAKRLTVGVGQSYLVEAYARAASSTRTCRLIAYWYTSGGSLVAEQELTADSATSTAWRKLSATVTPPWGATKLDLELATRRGTGETVYFDDITVTAQDVSREISGWLSEPLGVGLQPNESSDWRKMAVQLRCPDPFFSGPTDQFMSRFADTVAVFNPGDAAAWPQWSAVLASGYPITLTNSTIVGNPTMELDDTYASLTINTDPRALSIIDPSTDDPAWDAVSADSTFFPLLPGSNVISGTNIGPNSYIVGTFRPRWLTAW